MSYNTVSPVTGYYNMPVRWAADEKQAPVPGWGMWLADVGSHQDMVGIGATDPNAPPEVPATPEPSPTPSVSTSLALISGAVAAGAILGYLLCKGA